MAGNRARDHRTNIACLESLWNSDLENRLSVVPILDLVSRPDASIRAPAPDSTSISAGGN